MKRVFAKIGLFIVGSLFSVGIGEMLLRAFPNSQDALVLDLAWNELPAELYEPTPQQLQPGVQPRPASYQHRANTKGIFKSLGYEVLVESNSIGFRGVEPSEKGQVLLLGDSFVFAGQVPEKESFASILEENNPKVSVLNAGVDGYGTQQALNLWESKEDVLNVFQVVLFFFWGNDISDNLQYLEGGEILEQAVPLLPLEPAKYSRLYGRLYLLLSQDDSRVLEKNKQMRVLNEVEKRLEALSASQTALDRFNQRCQSLQISCSVVLIPPAEAFQKISMTEQVITDIKGIVPDELKLIDLFPELQKNGGENLYFSYDPHWNSYGHKVVAEILQRSLFEFSL